MGQIGYLIRLFGLPRLLRMKRRHDRWLPTVRGYALTRAIQALLDIGLLDALADGSVIDVNAYAREHGLDAHVLEALCEYLHCLRVLDRSVNGYTLSKIGQTILAEPRGTFDLCRGYTPVLAQLEDMLRGKKQYGVDVSRDLYYVAKGSGELGMQLPFVVMKDMILSHGFKSVLDMGCGDAEFLLYIAEGTDIECYGFDVSEHAIEAARHAIASHELGNRVHVQCADMFDIEKISSLWPDVEVFTADDVFHEYFRDQKERIVDLLRRYAEAMPQTAFLVAEFCRQSDEWLRKHPTAFVEHHLFHKLTNQEILSAEELRSLFRSAGYKIEDERVLDLVGHGYFLIRPER